MNSGGVFIVALKSNETQKPSSSKIKFYSGNETYMSGRKNYRCYLSEDTCMHFCTFQMHAHCKLCHMADEFIGISWSRRFLWIHNKRIHTRWPVYSVCPWTRPQQGPNLLSFLVLVFCTRASCSSSPPSNLIFTFICIRISTPLAFNSR